MKPYQPHEELLTTITGEHKRVLNLSLSKLEPVPYGSALSFLGKRMSGKINKGNSWLMRILIQVAYAAANTKNTYLKDKYHRIAACRGKKKAAQPSGIKSSFLLTMSSVMV